MFSEKKAVRPRGTDSARVIQVIVTEAIAGTGEPDDPVRTITEYWDFEGNRLAINDPAARSGELHQLEAPL